MVIASKIPEKQEAWRRHCRPHNCLEALATGSALQALDISLDENKGIKNGQGNEEAVPSHCSYLCNCQQGKCLIFRNLVLCSLCHHLCFPGVSQSTAGHFSFHRPLCQPCVSGEGWSTCLGPGRTRSARKGASVNPVVVSLQWWECAATTLSGHTYISWCFLLCPWGIFPPPSPVHCLSRYSSWELCVETLPSPGKTLWGAGMTLGWGCSLGLPAGDCHRVTAGSWAGFLGNQNTVLGRMVPCLLALLASLPNSFVIITIVMSWPSAMVTLAFPVTLGMVSLWPLGEWLMKSVDVHIAAKLCNQSRKSFTSWS